MLFAGRDVRIGKTVTKVSSTAMCLRSLAVLGTSGLRKSVPFP